MKKLIAILLAGVMLVAALPFASFAADDAAVTDTARVDAWEADYELLLDMVLDNEQTVHWNYVAQNNDAIADEMLTYTVFALYDDAWQNGFDKSVSITKAEQILASLIEKVDANVGDSKLDEIMTVLEGARDVNDFIQKVNGYIEISDVLTSQEWTDAFTYLNYAITLGNIWETEKEVLIDAYARILTVKAANDCYLELLSFIADNCSYDVVKMAAENLIMDINTSVDDLISEIMLQAAGNTAAEVVDVAVRIAADTNAYTALALKVYNTGTSVANTLWNTSDQYAIMDQLLTTFYVETAAAQWTKGILDARATEADAEKAVFAVSSLLTLREIGAKSLYDLKVAQSGGVIGQIKDQINKSVSSEYVAELMIFKAIREQLFADSFANAQKVTAVVTSFGNVELSACAADGSTLYTVPYGYNFSGGNNYGIFCENYNEYSRDYVKVAFLYDACDSVSIKGEAECRTTFIMDVLTASGSVVDYSFTDEVIFNQQTISIPLKFTGTPSFTKGSESKLMNDDYVYPVEREVTAETVGEAVVEVVRVSSNKSIERLKTLIKDFLERFFKGLFESLYAAKED